MRPELPPGHHTVEEMAEQFSTTKIALYKRLRELGVLYSDKKNGQKDGRHNHLRPFYHQIGWGYMTYHTWTKRNGEDQTQHSIGIPVFYQKGFDALKSVIVDGAEMPQLTAATMKVIEKNTTEPKREDIKNNPRTQAAADAALARLRKMDIF